MNVAALLQDSPSDERRRPSPTDRRQNQRIDGRPHAQPNQPLPSTAAPTPSTTATTSITPTTLPLHPTPILTPSSSRPLAEPIFHPPSPPLPSSTAFAHHRSRPVPQSPAMASLTPTPSRPSSSLTHIRDVLQPQQQSSWGPSHVYDPDSPLDRERDRERERVAGVREGERRDWERERHRDRERERKNILNPAEDHLPLSSMVGPGSTTTVPVVRQLAAASSAELFTVPSGPPVPTSRSGNKIGINSSSAAEDKDRDISDPDRERDRVERLHLSVREWVREPPLREREPTIREYDVRDRDRERDNERERDRERDREQRERDREDMDIIRAVASTRAHKPSPTVLQQDHTSPRTHTPTELLVLTPGNTGPHTHTHGHAHHGHGHSPGHPGHGHSHSHGHGHSHSSQSYPPPTQSPGVGYGPGPIHGHPSHPSHPSLPPPIPHPHSHSQIERPPLPPPPPQSHVQQPQQFQPQHQQPRPQQHFQSQFHTQFVLGPTSKPTSRIPSPSPTTPRHSANTGVSHLPLSNSDAMPRMGSPGAYEPSHPLITPVVLGSGNSSGGIAPSRLYSYSNLGPLYGPPPPSEQGTAYLHSGPPFGHHGLHGKQHLPHPNVIDINGEPAGFQVGISYGPSEVVHTGTEAKPFTMPHTNVPDFANPPPTEPTIIVHLGTYVYPRTPFPYLFPIDHTLAGSSRSSGVDAENATDRMEVDGDASMKDADKVTGPEVRRETRITIIVPSGFLPIERPHKPRIWGGGTIGYGSRRVYTDDSDVFLCAVHAGWVTWSGMRLAQRDGQDLRVELRIVDAIGMRFTGGSGERWIGHVQRRKEEHEYNMPMAEDGDDDGRGFTSAGWGSGHDGSGIEVLDARFVEKATGRRGSGLGLRNRGQRLLEYGERRAIILGLRDTRTWYTQRPGRKRRRGWTMSTPRRLPNAIDVWTIHEEDEESYMEMKDRAYDRKMSDTRTIVVGSAMGRIHFGFRYKPDVLRRLLFPPPFVDDGAESRTKSREPPRKRRRIRGERDDETASRGPTEETTMRDVILDTPRGSYLLTPRKSDPGRRYDVSLILLDDQNAYLDDQGAKESKSVVDGAPNTATPEFTKQDTIRAIGDRERAIEAAPLANSGATPKPTVAPANEPISTVIATATTVEVPQDNVSRREGTGIIHESTAERLRFPLANVTSSEHDGSAPLEEPAAGTATLPGRPNLESRERTRVVVTDIGEDRIVFGRHGVEMDENGTKVCLEVEMWRYSDTTG